jgi:hypothetical protein
MKISSLPCSGETEARPQSRPAVLQSVISLPLKAGSHDLGLNGLPFWMGKERWDVCSCYYLKNGHFLVQHTQVSLCKW